jgi:NADPH-dependent 2,4-dienoyl-CoA reductase/sulfur reductase-like enzyme
VKENLVIIGGVAAGLAAAMQARRRSPELDITVLEKTRDISYGACGMPYVISGAIRSLDNLIVHSPEYFQEKHNIEIRLDCEATEIFPAKSVVRVNDSGAQKEIGYTNLVLATGAAAVCPPIDGNDLDGIHVLRHIVHARKLLDDLERNRPRKAVIVGAGYIGLELAEAFRARGLQTTIIEASDKVMRTIDGTLRDVVVAELKRNGVEIIFGERVAAFEGRNRRISRVVTANNLVIDADIACVGVGVRANSELAKRARLEIGASGAIVTDAYQRTSTANIYAAGDCCEVINRVSGKRVWFPLGQPAVKQGWVAGTNACGVGTSEKYAGVVGTNIVKVFGLELARTGLGIDEAREYGFDVDVIENESYSRAGYYPNGSKILSRIIFDRRGKLLGAQMVGYEGVAQRIDVYAAALHASLKIEDIENFDLAYAPPFAPTIDPIQRAAHEASKKTRMKS